MNYSEEIKKLQARVERLEQQLPTESLISCSPVEPNLKIAKLTQAELEKLKPKHEYEFKVGDRVQFKTWEELEEEFGDAEDCNDELSRIELHDGIHFTSYMKFLCGTYATISCVSKSRVWLKDFTEKEAEEALFLYTLDMIKTATDEPRWTFTEDEKTILRNVDEDFKWLARDSDNAIYVYVEKPIKSIVTWNVDYPRTPDSATIPCEKLFPCIKWSDDEPCEFRKFL